VGFVPPWPILNAPLKSTPSSHWRTRIWILYSNIGESVLSAESTTRPISFARSQGSDREKFLSQLTYARQVTGNLEKRKQILNYGRKPILVIPSRTA